MRWGVKRRWVWWGHRAKEFICEHYVWKACVTVWNSQVCSGGIQSWGPGLTRTRGPPSQLLATSTLFLSQVPCPQRVPSQLLSTVDEGQVPQYSILNSNHQLYCQAVVTSNTTRSPLNCAPRSSFLFKLKNNNNISRESEGKGWQQADAIVYIRSIHRLPFPLL